MLDAQPAKVYKLKHLSKVEAVSSDNSGCTFVLVRNLFSITLSNAGAFFSLYKCLNFMA
jgi:hypothetical protein